MRDLYYEVAKGTGNIVRNGVCYVKVYKVSVK